MCNRFSQNDCLIFRHLFQQSLFERREKEFCFYFSENGFEDSLSTLGLVSGLFSAVWSAGYVLTKPDFLTFKITYYIFFKAVLFLILWKDVLRAHCWWIYDTETEF